MQVRRQRPSLRPLCPRAETPFSIQNGNVPLSSSSQGGAEAQRRRRPWDPCLNLAAARGGPDFLTASPTMSVPAWVLGSSPRMTKCRVKRARPNHSYEPSGPRPCLHQCGGLVASCPGAACSSRARNRTVSASTFFCKRSMTLHCSAIWPESSSTTFSCSAWRISSVVSRSAPYCHDRIVSNAVSEAFVQRSRPPRQPVDINMHEESFRRG